MRINVVNLDFRNTFALHGIEGSYHCSALSGRAFLEAKWQGILSVPLAGNSFSTLMEIGTAMNKKLMSYVATAALISLTAAQPAAAREFADIYTECGLGAMIAPNNSAVAAVTNVTWDLGTTAISSNISSPDSCAGGKAKKAAFIHDSYTQLESDIARGQGPHLTTLLTLSGCSSSVHADLAGAIRAEFAQTAMGAGYSSQTRFEQAQALYNVLTEQVQGRFASVCTAS